jgi:hypothetical protein
MSNKLISRLVCIISICIISYLNINTVKAEADPCVSVCERDPRLVTPKYDQRDMCASTICPVCFGTYYNFMDACINISIAQIVCTNTLDDNKYTYQQWQSCLAGTVGPCEEQCNPIQDPTIQANCKAFCPAAAGIFHNDVMLGKRKR